MANTPPKPPLRERSGEILLEELCLELRHVGVSDCDLPSGERVIQHISEVKAIYAELALRKLDVTSLINTLSKETSWKMKEFLDDCLAYPKRLPYVKEEDGIRRTLRCQLCRKAERAPDAKLFWFCESCLERIISALRHKTACDGVVIFRSYTPESRCAHADADTPLASEFYADQISGVCEKCVAEELERRRKLPPWD